MIVRDEAMVLPACLRSTRGIIDRWVIVDTGSIDDTRAVIDRELDGISGQIIDRPWIDFGHNRTELLALASEGNRKDYLLWLDADCTVEHAHARPLPPRANVASFTVSKSARVAGRAQADRHRGARRRERIVPRRPLARAVDEANELLSTDKDGSRSRTWC